MSAKYQFQEIRISVNQYLVSLTFTEGNSKGQLRDIVMNILNYQKEDIPPSDYLQIKSAVSDIIYNLF